MLVKSVFKVYVITIALLLLGSKDDSDAWDNIYLQLNLLAPVLNK